MSTFFNSVDLQSGSKTHTSQSRRCGAPGRAFATDSQNIRVHFTLRLARCAAQGTGLIEFRSCKIFAAGSMTPVPPSGISWCSFRGRRTPGTLRTLAVYISRRISDALPGGFLGESANILQVD